MPAFLQVPNFLLRFFEVKGIFHLCHFSLAPDNYDESSLASSSPQGERQNRPTRFQINIQSQHKDDVEKIYGRRSILNIKAEFVSKPTKVSVA